MNLKKGMVLFRSILLCIEYKILVFRDENIFNKYLHKLKIQFNTLHSKKR